MATYIDDYFDEHIYGIKFDGEDKVYTEDEIAKTKRKSDEAKVKQTFAMPVLRE